MSTLNKFEYSISLIQEILLLNNKLKRLRLREEFWKSEIQVIELHIIFASWELEYLLPEKYKTIVTNLSPLVPLLR